MTGLLLHNPPAEALRAATEVPALECVSFDPAPGVAPSERPPVRIYLGTEEAQERAERVFLHSVRKQRDPARAYRIYLMKDLPGFDRRGWRTGFTHYRFAIPELAGGRGRAIYNDVDQIYLDDPAKLFDLDLGGHGYRAVAANDTSVALIDCARMLPWWNLQAARTQSKQALVDAPAAEPGLWGELDAGWNARDFEYRAGASRLLHYTTLHLQPWQPTPQQYSYHPHPLAQLWRALESEADGEGYEPFSAAQPSQAFRRLASPSLEELPPQDVAWYLDSLFAGAKKEVNLALDLRKLRAPPDRPAPPRISRAADWWRERLATAAARRPGIAWQLDLLGRSGARRRYRYDPPANAKAWVLLGAHEGDNRQLMTLADALGWPYEVRRLRFKPRQLLPAWLQGASVSRVDRERSDPLEAPWPDLVLACGRRSAPVARWIRARSGGVARLVHLGRPRAPLSSFDLVVTTPQYRLPARANVVHNVLPLNRPAAPAAQAAHAWQGRLAALPRPRIALLVGGNSSSYVLGEAAARRLREQAEGLARGRGGSLLVVTSPRTPGAAADVLLDDFSLPSLRYRWRADDPENPYALFLGAADEFIVTADSASMLADACATGRPVRYAELPRAARRRGPGAFLLRRLERRWARTGERGTPRQQDALARRLDALVAAGVLRLPRDLAPLHEALRWSGLAQPLDDARAAPPRPAGSELERTVAAVHRVFLRGRAVPA